MRCRRLQAAVLLYLLLTVFTAACAMAADICPLPVDRAAAGPENGTFRLTVMDADCIADGGYFTAALFLQDRYSSEQVNALVPGDTVRISGRVWTVREIILHEGTTGAPAAREIVPVEDFDGYLVFEPCEDGTCLCVVNDWSPVTFIGTVRVTIPLPDRFTYTGPDSGEENTSLDSRAFLDALADYGEYFVAWNTSCVFENGMLTGVIHSDYPMGPEESFIAFTAPAEPD